MKLRTAPALLLALLLATPTAAGAQTPIEPPLPCPWWDCTPDAGVVLERYELDVTVDDQIATVHITQILRNDGDWLAEGEFLHPIPADAAVTDLTLWIDGEPVSGELLDADEAREVYEDIVRRTLDPALLEYADDGLLRLSVFPIEAGDTRQVEIEYQQVLPADGGLVRFTQPLGREHGRVEIEEIVTRVEIRDPDAVKSVYSPTHDIGVDRREDDTTIAGFGASGPQDSDFTLYYSTDAEPVSVDVLSFRDGDDGWFVLLASPGLVDTDGVTAKDVAIVIDTSGSMEGEKLEQAKRAAGFVLDNLNPDDRFGVISFNTGVRTFGDDLEPAHAADEAAEWVSLLAAGGSTNIERALATAYELEEPGRPLYVVFLTDGLPTEGIVDTQQILDSLDDEAGERTSLFAFGVGYDVDTILLDSLAAQHHGTTEYVVPGEEIDTAVATLYSKVASPVLTDVSLDVDGVDIWDLQPGELPDIFSGEQLVVAGRYDGWGPAEVSLNGLLRGEPVTIEYDDVRFTAAGGDESAASLWATRKIGQLLRSIRIDGPDDETIDQVVRISIRHGIVTPYTSYLVTEPSPFGDDAVDVISERAQAATTTLARSGEESVTAADAAGALSDSELAAAPPAEHADVVATAGGRTFRRVDGVWVDTTYDPDANSVRIALASDDYFELAASRDEVAAALALGPRVIVVVDGVAHEIVDPDAEADPLPAIEPTESATEQGPEAAPLVLGSETDDGDAGAATIALLSALLAASALAVVAARR